MSQAMTQISSPVEMSPLSPADLETVLSAWRETTLRLEQTHTALRGEVKRLTDELEIKNRELARKNRLADLGQMAAHVAHEVRNHLVPVTLYLSLLRRRIIEEPGNIEILDKITAGFTALDATVNDLLHFTAEREPQVKTIKLKKLIEDVCSSLAPQFQAQRINMVYDVSPAHAIYADGEMLRRAVLNLLLNAVDAMPEGGTINIRSADRSDCVELSIADTGPGLSDDVRHRIFEPFFTTKPGGTGLGLAIVYRIAEAHRAGVTADNNPQGGAVFGLRFPRAKLLEAAA
jgi:signal transduction histidine kinase